MASIENHSVLFMHADDQALLCLSVRRTTLLYSTQEYVGFLEFQIPFLGLAQLSARLDLSSLGTRGREESVLQRIAFPSTARKIAFLGEGFLSKEELVTSNSRAATCASSHATKMSHLDLGKIFHGPVEFIKQPFEQLGKHHRHPSSPSQTTATLPELPEAHYQYLREHAKTAAMVSLTMNGLIAAFAAKRDGILFCLLCVSVYGLCRKLKLCLVGCDARLAFLALHDGCYHGPCCQLFCEA